MQKIVPNPSPKLKAIILCPQPCRSCNHPGPHGVARGKGPHRAALRCGKCETFVQWLSGMALDMLDALEGEVQV